MATTIKSTDLDFQNIKESLKVFLRQKEEFRDYDFEGAGLSNILDVLAYNTHYNGLIANFALNESYLTTAQLRPSMVSLSESLGYIPGSRTSAQLPINLVWESTDTTRDRTYSILPGEMVFRGDRDGIEYTFSNRETLIATDNGAGVYTFKPRADEEAPVIVFEGEEKVQRFLVDQIKDSLYVIPDQDMDIDTAIIKVFEDQSYIDANSTSGYVLYINLLNATEITELSRLYVLRESPNGNFELTFGNGTTIGIIPEAGQVVDVNYLKTKGSEGNGIASVSVVNSPEFMNNLGTFSVSVTARSSGGKEKETIESIRKNAPFQYATQNRMVTGLDYSSLIIKKFGQYIKDIKSWGGEDDPKPDYGSVFTSIVWEDNLPNSTIANTRREILKLADDFSVVSFRLNFVEPVETYIATQLFYQFNPSLTSVSQSSIDGLVDAAVVKYFEDNTGKFDQVYRRSNMLTDVDEVDASVLSSRCDVELNRRFYPTFRVVETHDIDFPVSLRGPDEQNTMTIRSSYFVSKGKTVYIRNKLNAKQRVSPVGVNPVVFKTAPSATLELVDQNNLIVDENIGNYNPQTGRVSITGLDVQRIIGGRNFIKLFAIPANQSAIDATLNTILRHDPEESFTRAITVSTR